MNKLVCCVIYDRVADLFNQPIFFPSVGGAIRSFVDEINRADAQNMLYQHSDDFDLFQLGEFNCVTGKFDLFDDEKKLIMGREAKSVVSSAGDVGGAAPTQGDLLKARFEKMTAQ